jgi:hypothetical protein
MAEEKASDLPSAKKWLKITEEASILKRIRCLDHLKLYAAKLRIYEELIKDSSIILAFRERIAFFSITPKVAHSPQEQAFCASLSPTLQPNSIGCPLLPLSICQQA